MSMLFALFGLLISQGIENSACSEDSFMFTADLPSGNEFLPGAPVLLTVRIYNQKSIPAEGARLDVLLDLVCGRFDIQVEDLSGQVVVDSYKTPWVTSDSRYHRRLSISPNKSETTIIVLNDFCTTDIPEGNYNLCISFGKFSYRWLSVPPKACTDARINSSSLHDSQRFDENSSPIRLRLPICVKKKDEEKVSAMYRALGEVITKKSGMAQHYSSDDITILQQAIDQIVFARTLSALPIQMQLFSGDLIQSPHQGLFLNPAHYLGFARYIIASPKMELVNAVTELINSPRPSVIEFLKDGGIDFFTWALFKTYETGPCDIKQALEPFVHCHECPREPQYYWFID